MSRKNVFWNTLGTSANAFTSLFFLIIVTRINGLDQAGVFSFAFSNACILSIIGMYMGRTYQVSESDKSITDSDYIYNRCFTCFIMLVITIIMLWIFKYSREDAIIFGVVSLYKMLEAFSDVVYGILQRNGKLHLVGKSFFIKSVFSVSIFVLVDIVTQQLWLACVMMCIACLGIIVFYDFANLRSVRYTHSKFKMQNMVLLLKRGIAMCVTTLLANYIISASKYAIQIRGYSQCQAVFGIILMPATVLSLLGQFIIQPCSLGLTVAYSNHELKKMRSLTYKMLLIMLGVGIGSVVAAYALGIPILEVLYGVPLAEYKTDLLLIMVGAVFYGCGIILLSILTIMRYTNIQMIIYILLSVIAFFSSFILVAKWHIRGATVSYLLIMILEFGVYVILTIKCYSIEIKK